VEEAWSARSKWAYVWSASGHGEDPDQAGRERSVPCLFILGWLAGSAVLMGLGFYIASVTDATL
jgi:hypothetical protein